MERRPEVLSLRRTRRRLPRLLLALGSAVLGLELLMQSGALVVWVMQRSRAPEIPAGQDVVLCVGDSWTHGMGSSDAGKHSYPAVLQGLEPVAGGWTVVNGGQSGQNSRDVLQRLPSQLAEFRPRIVCVLVGRNDFWSVPAELPADGDAIGHEAYRFRWRIPRLVAWVAGRLGGGDAPARTAAPMAGPEWEPRRPTTAVPYANEPRKWRASAAASKHEQAGWQLYHDKDIPGAIREFELTIAECPESASARQGLAIACRLADRKQEMTVQLDWLRESWRRDGDYRTGQAFVSALDECGKYEEELEVACKVIEGHPLDAIMWRYRAQAEFFLGRHADAARSIDESIRLGGDRWAYMERYRIHLHGFSDLDEALRSLYSGYVAWNDAAFTLMGLRGTTGVVPRMRRVLEAFECAPDVKGRLSRLVDEVEAAEGGAEIRQVLAAHLTRIASLVRGAGGTPVFLNYPVASEAESTQREAAAGCDAAFVDVRRRFEELLAGRPWTDFKAPDGHCNDAGYQLMAQAVVEGITPLLAK
jgi:lysophospholipase L1-like esterase